eukprot:3145568-Amphidinium_carterae.1
MSSNSPIGKCGRVFRLIVMAMLKFPLRRWFLSSKSLWIFQEQVVICGNMTVEDQHRISPRTLQSEHTNHSLLMCCGTDCNWNELRVLVPAFIANKHLLTASKSN